MSFVETGKPRREDEILEADGTAAVGAKVENQRIIINKEMPAVRVSAAAEENAGSLAIQSTTPANAVYCSVAIFLYSSRMLMFMMSIFVCSRLI